jgi:hypothetical protein
MASSYTPGPWEIDRDRAGFLLGVTPSRCAPGAAPVCYTPPIVANAEADARLIAASPDLLESAVELEGWIARVLVHSYTARRPMPENLEVALTKVRAAIAKATGSDQ